VLPFFLSHLSQENLSMNLRVPWTKKQRCSPLGFARVFAAHFHSIVVSAMDGMVSKEMIPSLSLGAGCSMVE
jgi:hypothetical protein